MTSIFYLSTYKLHVSGRLCDGFRQARIDDERILTYVIAIFKALMFPVKQQNKQKQINRHTARKEDLHYLN